MSDHNEVKDISDNFQTVSLTGFTFIADRLPNDYQMYRKHYKEIIDAVLDFDYSNMSNIGLYFVISAIEKGVPEISRAMIQYFCDYLPLTLSKSTQRMIEKEKQKSMKILSELK